MLDCNYQLKNTVLEKEKGNSIISKIMESLKGLNVTTAEFLLEECKKGNLPNSKDLKCTFNNFLNAVRNIPQIVTFVTLSTITTYYWNFIGYV